MLDTAVRNWAQTYYEVADLKVFAANSTAFQAAFPGFALYEVVELTRHPATVHAMAWNNSSQAGYDVTKGFNGLVQAAGLADTSSRALAYGKALADAGNVEVQPKRQTVNASDSTWLGVNVSDPAVSPTLDGWKVETWTWSIESGVLAKWEVRFALGLATRASWNVTHLQTGNFERRWEAFRLLPDTLLTNNYILAYSFSASRTTASGTVPLLLENDIEGASYTTVITSSNFDGSQWVVSYAGNGSSIAALAGSLAEAAPYAYSWQVGGNGGPGACSTTTNPKTSWNFTSRDPDCQLEIRVIPSDALFCAACIDGGNQTRIYVTDSFAAWMTTDLGWYNLSAFDLTSAARNVVAHLHLVTLKTTSAAFLPDVDTAQLPGDQLTSAGRIDPEHFFFQALQEDAFWTLHARLSNQTGYLGLVPAMNGTHTLHAAFSGVPPQGINAILPDSWRLQVAGNVSQTNLALQCPSLYPEAPVPLPWEGIGPGSKLLFGDRQEIPPHSFCYPNECTANFIFANNTDLNSTSTRLFLGTAAHCMTRGPYSVCVSACVVGGVTGIFISGNLVSLEAAYVGHTNDRSKDFALLEIPADRRADVRYEVPVWGGPTGIECPPDSYQLPTDVPLPPDPSPLSGPPWLENTTLVLTYGNGIVAGEVSHWRAGIHQQCGGLSPFTALLPATAGDSGGPLVVARPAGGALVGGGAYGIMAHVTPGPAAGIKVIGPTLASAINTVYQDKGWSLHLVCPDQNGGGRICG